MVETVDTSTQKDKTIEEEMKELYETSMRNLQEGNIIKGRVIDINGDTVIVDVGLKSEGKVSMSEFLDKSGTPTVSVGDEVEVMVVGREIKDGLLSLSKQRVDGIKIWHSIDKALEEGTPVEGPVVSEVKGGFIVDIGVSAFLPISQVDVKPVKNPASFIGRNLKYKVIKVNQKKANVIVSRRMLIEEEKERKRAEFWKNVKEGQVIYGFVKSITDYGAFIDLGGVDGFLYVNDITWGRITHPKEYLKLGDEVKVKIMNVDFEKHKVSVSIKDLKGDPWARIDEKYPVGSKVKGKVVGVVEYGAFVELEPGLEGLLHVSEMSWDKKMRNPAKLVAKGDMLELQVLDIDKEKKRISLGLKQLRPDPWKELAEKYPSGSVVKGKVKNFTDFGLFVGMEDGIDGLVHISEISWSRRKNMVAESYKKGTQVDALVLNIDPEHKKFSLSIKRLREDPWKGLPERYRVGDTVEGYVTSITDFGVFVEIEEGIEGLIHLSEIDNGKGKHPSELFSIDDVVKAMVINVDEREKRIGLSTKALKKAEEKKEVDSFSREETRAFSTLGDLLEPAMKKDSKDREA
ncbi:MAG: 30S ribosomal protein S1 [Syntrophorhabdaceae bacterium PtaU1.Bin034]|nr:MAG: 30S ribosomal protein S1 [Syntrophorhabdaceae bacterium PtaU1.Bin034]